jgi:predicted phosphohydrolase
MKQWPNIGSKITFRGVHQFWFVNIVKDANELLEIGKEYTISKLELASSWCGVILEEFPEHKFALSFFDYEKELTLKEVTKLENLTLKELRDRDSMVDDCENHAEVLKNTKTPEDAVKFMETSDKIQELISGYDVEVDKILKAFDGKLKNNY